MTLFTLKKKLIKIQYGGISNDGRLEHTLQHVELSTLYPLLRICFPLLSAFYKYNDISTLFLYTPETKIWLL